MRSMKIQLLAAVAMGVVAGGCSGDESPREIEAQLFVEDYDRDCSTHEDCVLVTEGDACACRECFNASIARSARSQWESDLDEASRFCDEEERMLCGSLELETRRQASTCPDFLPTCVDGVCQAVEPNTDL